MVTGAGCDQEASVRMLGGGYLGHDPDPGVVTFPAHYLLLLYQRVNLRGGTLPAHHHCVIREEHEAIWPALEINSFNNV